MAPGLSGIALADTTAAGVQQAVTAGRRAAGVVATGLVLTLVVLADERHAGAALSAAEEASLSHPCRQIVVVRHTPDAPVARLDAVIEVAGTHGPGEAIVVHLHGRLALHPESVVLPLLAPDAPVVCWWVGEPPQRTAHDPVGVLANRRITDCAAADDPLAALLIRAREYVPGDTDLAWTRLTGWRSLLAAWWDTPVGRVHHARVQAAPDNPSAWLLAAWLQTRLDAPVHVSWSRGPGITGVEVTAGPHDSPETFRLRRLDGIRCQIERTGHPARTLPLPRRDMADLLAEELHRLGPDDPYAEALGAADALRRDAVRTGRTAGEGTPVVTPPQLAVYADPAALAQATAGLLTARLAAAQAEHGQASVVLTGGGIGIAVLEALAAVDRCGLAWEAVDVWWGDERFVPHEDPQRNAGQARPALRRLGLDPARTHEMAASDGPEGSPEAAARSYAAQLAAAGGSAGTPAFDVLLLGVGPEGHVASLFPHSPALEADEAVVAVRGCPKPPPTRVSMTLATITAAREVWIVAAGEAKAGALGKAWRGAPTAEVPVAGARGRSRTRWLLDTAAAAELDPRPTPP